MHAPLGAVGTVGGPAEREQAPGGALLRGVGELLAAQVIEELLDGELVHEDFSFFPGPGGLVVSFTVASRPGGHHT